jgi:hypothetical protein
MLLWTNNHPRAHEAHVCYHLVGSEAMAEDEICANQASSATKTCFAMDCDALLSDSDDFVSEVDKLPDQRQWRTCAVIEDHVEMLNAESGEVRG